MSTPVGPYRPVVQVGDMIFVSGQVGLVDGSLAEGVGAQVDAALANLGAHLETVGAELSDVVKTTVFLTDMDDYATMNERYVAAFGRSRPARSAVAVAALPIGALVEIEAIAMRGA